MPTETKSTTEPGPMEQWLIEHEDKLVNDSAFDAALRHAREQDALTADLKEQRDGLLVALDTWAGIHADFNAMLEASMDDESIVASLDGRMDAAAADTEAAISRAKAGQS